MKSIVLLEPGKFRLENTAEPAPPAEVGVQVRVVQVGICGTDLHAFEGKQPFFSYPRILDYDLAGEIIQLGPADEDHDPGVCFMAESGIEYHQGDGDVLTMIRKVRFGRSHDQTKSGK